MATDRQKTLLPDRIPLAVVLFVFVLVLLLALSVPFFYPTQTLWYKFGIDRLLLQGGQFAGLITVVLLFSQFVLGMRPVILQKAFGTSRLVRMHRINGIVLVGMALSHITLVLLPEGITNLPLGLKFWPQLVGLGALIMLALTVGLAQFREKTGMRYPTWKIVHRIGGYTTLVLVVVHVMYVSESFHHWLPRLVLLVLVVGTGIMALTRLLTRGK